MKTNPLISVVMSTRNRSKMIGFAIKSVLEQTYTNFEFIIVDGASDDDTQKVVESFTDSRIRYFCETNDYSHPNCLRIAIKEAKGELVALQDDDDEWYPQKLEKQVKLFERSDDSLGLVYCWEQIYDWTRRIIITETKQSIRGDVFLDLLEYPGYGGGSLMMFRREVINTVPFILTETKLPSDYLWCTRVAKVYKFDYVPEVLSRTNINHIYGRLTNLECNSLNRQDAIDLEEVYLKTFASDFSIYPEKRKYHYRSIINNATTMKNNKIFLKYFFRAFPLFWTDYRYYGYLVRFVIIWLGLKKI